MSFLQNKYTRTYYRIIEKAQSKNRKRGDDYFESHHILPKSMGGSDDVVNRVLLTAREHFLCHWLLTKMCASEKDRRKMQHALSRLVGLHKTTERIRMPSWKYEVSRKHHSQATSERTSGEGNPMFGRSVWRGKKRPEQAAALRGRKHSAETRARMSKPKASVMKVCCVHCGKQGIVSNINRWHNDNCKVKVAA